MEREVGGGSGMGNTCKPLAVSFQCMTKSTTNKKKKVAVAFVQCIVARCSKVIRSHLHFKGKKQIRGISTLPKALTVNGKVNNSELLI